ncbi:MAG: sugar transferase [Phycisphaerales bacterium]|nr:sugar transferase [Phycisphaerales bacterium]
MQTEVIIPQGFIRRLIDIVASGMILLVISIPLLTVMLILRLTGEGEIWFLHERIGQGGRRFKVYKFATMRKDSEWTGNKDITLRNDPRVLPFGKFLRKTKINELPQLINIFMGDMSFVGWRPLIPKSFEYYPQHIQQQITRLKPGLTGIGSVVFCDEEAITARTVKPPQLVYREDIAPYKGELELWYQQRRSFWLDMRLILLTMVAIVKPQTRLYEKWLKELPPRPASLG